MNKQEFLEKLRLALSGKVPPDAVADNLAYYENYINTQIRQGKSEQEVLEALGDPRLIARTIVETSGRASSGESGGYADDARYQDAETGRKDRGSRAGNKTFRMPGWVILLLVIVVLAVVFSLAFSVLSFLMPVLLPILAVVFLVKLFRDWLN